MRSDIDRVIARIKAVYGQWGRDTPIDRMRKDWDDFFKVALPADAAIVRFSANGVRCAFIRPPGVSTAHVIVYLHGGGYRVGSLRSHQEIMVRLAQAANAQVLGVEYRLSPEHGFPAPLEDMLAVVSWLQSQGFPGYRVAFAGDSAGAGLALATLLKLQAADVNESGIAPADGATWMPAAAFLMSAWTDLAASGASYETRAASDPIHQRPMIRAMARAYLGSAVNPENPFVSPLYASDQQLSCLPPLMLQVGDRETVLSDSEVFARRVEAAGGSVELQIWPEMIHVFQQFPAELPEAVEAMKQGGHFLARQLGLASQGDTSS